MLKWFFDFFKAKGPVEPVAPYKIEQPVSITVEGAGIVETKRTDTNFVKAVKKPAAKPKDKKSTALK